MLAHTHRSHPHLQDMVRDWIITATMEAMLAKGRGGRISEDSVEAACEVLSTAGAKIAANTTEKMQRKLEEVMRQLAAIEKDKSMTSRIRFVVRDVMVGGGGGNWGGVKRLRSMTSVLMVAHACATARGSTCVQSIGSASINASCCCVPVHRLELTRTCATSLPAL